MEITFPKTLYARPPSPEAVIIGPLTGMKTTPRSAADRGGDYLIASQNEKWELYNPFDTPEMFREFADLNDSTVLGFVRKFGMMRMWSGVAVWIDGVRGSAQPIRGPEGWEGRIDWMRYSCRLWDLIRAGDEQGLSELITVKEDSLCLKNAPHWWHGGVIRNGPFPIGLPPLPDPNEVSFDVPFHGAGIIACAEQALSRGVNAELADIDLVFKLSRNESEKRPVLEAEVVKATMDLWKIMCFQLATAISEDHQFQKCGGCGKWFLLQPGVNRANRLTCSNACRKKVHRARLDEALRLHDQGLLTRDIAKQVGSDINTVKKWIAHKE